MFRTRFPRRLMPMIFSAIFGYCLIFFANQSFHISYKEYLETSQQLVDEKNHSIQENKVNNFNIVSVEGSTDEMYNKIRIICWVLTAPKNHEAKARVVKETWGSRCNTLLFVSSESDPTLPTIKLPVFEGRNQLWGKTREAFRYVWNNYKDKADWFLKADDDSFVILENLRYFLSGFNTSEPMWFGHRFKVLVEPEGYFSGGAGYVLSKEALRRFIEDGYFNGIHCRHDHAGAEDAEMGRCMSYLNVSTMDTRDSQGRGRFFPFAPYAFYSPGPIVDTYWYWKNIYYPPNDGGKECCSDSTVSFHYINPEYMRTLYYLLYQLRVFGREVDQRPSTPAPPPDVYSNHTPWFIPTTTSTTTTTTISTTTTTTSVATKRHFFSTTSSTTTTTPTKTTKPETTTTLTTTKPTTTTTPTKTPTTTKTPATSTSTLISTSFTNRTATNSTT